TWDGLQHSSGRGGMPECMPTRMAQRAIKSDEPLRPFSNEIRFGHGQSWALLALRVRNGNNLPCLTTADGEKKRAFEWATAKSLLDETAPCLFCNVRAIARFHSRT